ncbi:LysR family transcriptional regulator [Candidimonas humi]|uniref:LysR family transcriptional regulator n=1 Tax=Candidimonas humi TaxID=683355 RepID=A0ABV8NUF3_9BURK|nr:LysR family transcriptional regulator [Candidimonas humi]
MALLGAMYRHGTVTAAAAAVAMTQPAASALLRNLEVRLGFGLFSREHRRLRLTSQGRALIPEVLNALAAIEAADRLASDICRGAQARIAVGAVAIAAASLLPPALSRTRQAYPNVALAVRAGTSLDIIEMAVDHRIDLGIIVGAPADKLRVASLELAALSLFAVMRRDHPWADRRELTLGAVAATNPIVLATALPAGLATRSAIESLGLAYSPMTEVAQSSAACALAEEGLGIAIVEGLGARYAQRHGLCARHLLAVEDLTLALVWPKDSVMSQIAELFKENLVAEAARWHLPPMGAQSMG